ncbi:hypothetical protein C8J57DRAFT_1318221 [Mycena rebaudengoi]|nr:hypothetical protein C8J57DRAFT_1410462 [Mycena rebaudengoi]KAJ7245196.1 hypothetical protein C8J57DRAFT_1362489 [Mycena rebaudengoi]KAJ7272273.1 hypothetical protein C8J57DRAFT_1318221 [Mycena rebaudengoi]
MGDCLLLFPSLFPCGALLAPVFVINGEVHACPSLPLFPSHHLMRALKYFKVQALKLFKISCLQDSVCCSGPAAYKT